MKNSLLILIFMLLIGDMLAFPVRVSLFNSRQIRSVVISAWDGDLIVSSSERFHYYIASGQAIYAGLRDGKILLSDANEQLGSFESITVSVADSLSLVRLRPVLPQIDARDYEEMIIITADVDKIHFVNQIDADLYIAGVVEAETGQRQTGEFYKAKGIICRTYLYRNINTRHENEDFHLCDEVHCQAYKGRCKSRNMILAAVKATGNVILTNPRDSEPIVAVYHSNCGGETESSQNVWQSSQPYLVSVADNYCTSSHNAKWQRTVLLDDWIAYLVKNGFIHNSPGGAVDYSFQQRRRMRDYKINNTTIPLNKIRADWQFKSTYFSISLDGGNVIFSGRGYGHGVGLCQEGAMEMGRRGFKYDEIIKFYYKNINFTNAEP